MYHYFYLAQRNRRLTSGQFIDRWRRHAVLAAAQPEFWSPVRRYVQNDVRPDGLPGITQITTGFDALGEFFFDRPEDKPDAPQMLIADMAEIAGPGRPGNFGGEREVVSGTPQGPYRVVRILAQAPGGVQDAQKEALCEGAAALEGIGVAVSTSTQPGLPFGAAVMVWVSDLEAAENW
jgi:hypothetical protein